MLKMASADPIVDHGRYKPISIVLQPNTNISNGYVGLAPYASELYLEPHENPFTLGSLPWTDVLALHEYRHVQQINAANTGFSHLFKTIFGDLVFSGLYALSVPNWYREGDAVYSESKWSLQGRGRLSSFTLPFYEKALEGDPWNYYKARNGSYKEYTPDYYALGYMMIQYGNQYFGEAIWDSIVHRAPRFQHILRPFSGLVKKQYGKKTKGLYLDAMQCYHDDCSMTRVRDVLYPTMPLKPRDRRNGFFDMTFPEAEDDGSLYVALTTFDQTAAIYKFRSTGERKKIVSPGFQKDSYFNYHHGRLVWTEFRYDPRWIRRDKSVIVLYDIEHGGRKTFKPEKGYFTPSLNAHADRIVALHENQKGHYELRILDASTGEIITALPNPENLYLGYPCFNEREDSIIATARNEKGEMCIVEQDIRSGNFRYITSYTYTVLGRPVYHGPWIFLTAGFDQLDQVYAVDRSQGIFYQCSFGNDAHFDPAWDPVNEQLICSEFRLNGKKLVWLPGTADQWKVINIGNGIKALPGFTGRNILAEPDDGHDFKIKK
ncbi:MAG TPA: hypothetical protein VJ508_03540, partial [Saprospiraceae bacterium]|nr:hypothetical protein [Saprospiraceae bacterium]